VGIVITALGAKESVMNSDDEKNAGAPADDSVDRSIELGMCKRDDGTTEVTIMDASDMGLFGIKNRDFFHGLVRQIANAGAKGKHPDELGVSSMLGFIIEGKPTDAIEASILSQMAVFQRALMEAAHHLSHATSLAEADFADRSVNRLARTFADLADLLLRFRASKVQKLNIHKLAGDGAPANIGNLAQPTQQALLSEGATAPLVGRRRQLTSKRRSEEAAPRRRRNQHGQP
jgi:hypothetical protein